MTHDCPDVKSRLSRWVDSHPRLGWYVAAWAFLISIEASAHYIDWILHAIG